ncbi:MAG TPA: hypothetical protein VKC34_12655, partial [Blastocatellia bacterium]|nr:hypothetical protein [Blastocatellia bacterium]
PFFKDWFDSVRSLRGWRDGDAFYINYIAHPMMGATAGFIQIQNDVRGSGSTFAAGPAYRNSRLKALGWSTLFSTLFEIGPLSEASLGNVGLGSSTSSAHPFSYVDLVVTPAVGTAWVIGEDAIDCYVIERLERRTGSLMKRRLARSLLNPTRSLANLVRGRKPWLRDNRSMGR